MRTKAIGSRKLLAKNLTQENAETLRGRLEKLDAERDQLQRERIESENRLRDHRTQSDKAVELKGQLEDQQRIVNRWSALSKLIGSRDGSTFRRFAQGITFEQLLAFSNLQLRRLTDRYELRKGSDGLNSL